MDRNVKVGGYCSYLSYRTSDTTFLLHLERFLHTLTDTAANAVNHDSSLIIAVLAWPPRLAEMQSGHAVRSSNLQGNYTSAKEFQCVSCL